MSTKAEEFAAKLIERTKENKLKWRYIPDPDVEKYKTDAEAGISFSIARKAWGDDKILTFELAELDRVVLSDTADNSLTDPKVKGLSERERKLNVLYPTMAVESSDEPKIRRFRLYSDLFYAVRKVAEGRDLAIEKAEQFLARLA